MEESRELLENTDWSVLHHAYDFATDTPKHLEALLVGDEASVKEAGLPYDRSACQAFLSD